MYIYTKEIKNMVKQTNSLSMKGGVELMEEEILIKKCTCERCGHQWIPRIEETPGTCAKCRSPYWNRPRKVLIENAK